MILIWLYQKCDRGIELEFEHSHLVTAYKAGAFCLFTESGHPFPSVPCQGESRTFSVAQEDILHPFGICQLPVSTASLWQLLLSFLSLRVCPSWPFHVNGIIQYDGLVAGCFYSPRGFQVHLRGRGWGVNQGQCFVPGYC